RRGRGALPGRNSAAAAGWRGPRRRVPSLRGAAMTASQTGPLASLEGVSVVFEGGVRALDDVTLAIERGTIVGLVGESGSGKTTLGRVLIGLTPATAGRVTIGGTEVAALLADDPLAFRRRVQMLLQDAVSSLSPRMTVARTLEEPIRIHALPRAAARERLAAI